MSVSVVIPAAGVTRRLQEHGPLCLTRLPSGKTLLQTQVEVLRASWLGPEVEIVVVGGFMIDRVHRAVRNFSPRVRLIANRDFARTGPTSSVRLGMLAAKNEDVLVCYGNVHFPPQAVELLGQKTSSLLVEKSTDLRRPGAMVEDGRVTNLAYGLPTCWSELSLLRKPERDLFLAETSSPVSQLHLCHEVFNRMIQAGTDFLACTSPELETHLITVSDIDSDN